MYFPLKAYQWFVYDSGFIEGVKLFNEQKQAVSKDTIMRNFEKYYEIALNTIGNRNPYTNKNYSIKEIKNIIYMAMKGKLNELSYDQQLFFQSIENYITNSYKSVGMRTDTISYGDLYDELFFFEEMVNFGKNKQVYKLDNDFAENLLNTSDFVLTREDVNHLPNDTFWIDLENVDKVNEIKGILVNIEKFDGYTVVESYQIAEKSMTADTPTYYSHRTIFDENVATLDSKMMKEKYAELSKMLNNAFGTIENILTYNGKETGDDRLENTILTYQLLQYMTSKEPDLSIVEPEVKKVGNQIVKKAVPSNKKSEITTTNIGYVFGTVFRQYKEQVANYVKSEQASGRTVRPHFVSAHWQRYKIGEGRTEVVTKWIEPYFTGIDKNKVQDFCTIHKVLNTPSFEDNNKGEYKDEFIKD